MKLRTTSETWARLLLLAAGLAAGLGMLEAGARGLAAASPRAARVLADWDPLAFPGVVLTERCYRPLPGNVVHYDNGTQARANVLGYRGPAVAIPKPSGTFRVVLLGGSTSHGYGVDDTDTIDAHLRTSLARQRPDRRFEVVNLGFDGYDSECDCERLRESGLPLQPDAVIIHSGVNDTLGASRTPPVRANPLYEQLQSRARRREQPSGWDLLKHHAYAARLPGVVKHAVSPPRPFAGPPDPPVDGPDLFERNLRRMLALTTTSTLGLFSTPPSELSDPTKARACLPVVDAATTQRYRDALAARMRRVAADMTAHGRRAAYVEHSMPAVRFIDDCHLDGEGNRLLAEDFAAALLKLIATPGGEP